MDSVSNDIQLLPYFICSITQIILLHSKTFRLVFSEFRKTVPFPAHLETVAYVRN